MKTTMIGFDQISLGHTDLMAVGGMESMSNVPYLLPKMRSGARLGHDEVKDHMFLDGLEDAYEKGSLMGTFAEDCAKKYQFTRQLQDEYALTSLSNALKERGESGDIIPGPFACDCRHLVNQGGIPSVIFGPGTIAQAHKPDEHIEIEEYLACIEHLIAFIGSWCNETRDRSFEDAAKEALPL